MGNTVFLHLEIIIAIFFCIFDLKIQQDKKCIAFFAEKIQCSYCIVRMYAINALID